MAASEEDIFVDHKGDSAGIKGFLRGAMLVGFIANIFLPRARHAFDGEAGAEEAGGFFFDACCELGVFFGVLVGDKAARIGDEEPKALCTREVDFVERMGSGGALCLSGGRRDLASGRRLGGDGAGGDGFFGKQADLKLCGVIGLDLNLSSGGDVTGAANAQGIGTRFDAFAVDGGISDEFTIQFESSCGR